MGCAACTLLSPALARGTVVDQRDVEYGRIAVKNSFLSQEQLDGCLRLKEGLKAKYGKDYQIEELLIEKGFISDTQNKVVLKVLARLEQGKESTTEIHRRPEKRATEPGMRAVPKPGPEKRATEPGMRAVPKPGPERRATEPGLKAVHKPGAAKGDGGKGASGDRRASTGRAAPRPDAPGKGTAARPAPPGKIDLVEEEIDVEAPPPEDAGQKIRCTYCGQWNPLGLANCPRCAHVLPQPGGAVAARAIHARHAASGRPAWIAPAIVVGGLAVTGVALFFVLSGSDGGKNTPSSNGGDGSVGVSKKDVERIEEQTAGGRKAEEAGDDRLAWDRYRQAERDGEALLADAQPDDPLRREINRVYADAGAARKRVADKRLKYLSGEVVKARKYLKEGDWTGARGVALEARKEAESWQTLLSRENLGGDSFTPVLSESKRILDEADRLEHEARGGVPVELAGKLSEFQTIARNLLSISDREGWATRRGDFERVQELAAEIVGFLAEGDPQRSEIERQIEAVRARDRELSGGGSSGGGSSGGTGDDGSGQGSNVGPGGAGWLPADGPWLLISGAESRDAGEIAAELLPLIPAQEAESLDPAFFAPAFLEGVGILIDKRGAAHRGVLEEKETVWMVESAGRKHSVLKDQVEQVIHGTTYLFGKMPEAARDVTGKAIPGRPVRAEPAGVVFEGEGAPVGAVPFSAVLPEDLYPTLQNIVLAAEDAQHHLELGRICLAAGLKDEAREEYLEAVRKDRSSILAGLAEFHPNGFYAGVDARAGEDAKARFLLALWARQTFTGSERFMAQLRRAMELDPASFGNAWTRLALAIWFQAEKKIPDAIAEAQAVAETEGASEEARTKAKAFVASLEGEKKRQEAERAARINQEFARAVLSQVRERTEARSRSAPSWKEDRNWAQVPGGLLKEAQEAAASELGVPPADVNRLWRARLAVKENDWPARPYEVGEEIWLADMPRILNSVHGEPSVSAEQAVWYASLDPASRAKLLELLFVRRNLEAVKEEKKPCPRCNGEDALKSPDDYKARFGSIDRLCQECHGVGYHLSAAYR
ncbi:MAG: hypothetical protein HY720_32475 [Planctomycetes bacterium]|nr:hypothetical protein [Planctomycetota bacterium]